MKHPNTSPTHSNIRTFEHSNISPKGFTLVELLVASLLLSMLVTMLTMIFNQSSIAWRTGTAGVAELQKTRRQLGAFHDGRDSALPGVGEDKKSGSSRSISQRTVSLFEKNSNKLKSGRAYGPIKWDGPSVSSAGNQGETLQFGGGDKAGGSTFTVGVRSLGPDGKISDDDITTWPSEVF